MQGKSIGENLNMRIDIDPTDSKWVFNLSHPQTKDLISRSNWIEFRTNEKKLRMKSNDFIEIIEKILEDRGETQCP